MVKTSTLIGIAIVGVAAVVAYLILSGKIDLGNAGGLTSQQTPFSLGGQGPGNTFASGGSSISETFNYSPMVQYSVSQIRTQTTYRVDPRTGLFVIG